jgi:cobalt-zinc-cadmium efflux system membrane fusion protein
MTTNAKVFLSLLLACGVIAPACGQEKDHDHDHDHDKPIAATKPDIGHAGHGDDHGHVDEVKLTAEAIRQWNIRVEPAKKRVLAATFIAPARVAFNAEAMAHVGSLVPGRVVEIKVRVGDVVKKSDELLVIESTELGQAQSEYLQRRTDLAVVLSTVEPAKHAYERAKKLYDQSQGISLGEVQKREAEMKAAEGHALTAKAAAVAALNRLLLRGMTKDEVKELEDKGMLNPKLSVRAPIAGRVIEREVTLGELVSPEKEKLMVLAGVENVWVLADVSESRLPQVMLGSPAQVQLAALPGQRFEGKVSHVAPALNPDTRTGSVRIEVANPDDKLRPGMFASVMLTASTAGGGEAVLAVPDEAVQTVEGAPAVFVPVEGEANTFAKRTVTVGKPAGGMVPVLSGLKEGEPVVVSGTFILKAELGKSEASHEH